MGKRRALILDRDGVINVDHGYVHRPDQCQFVDGIFELARAFADRGFLIVIATNQAGIGRGLYGEEDFQAFMAWMKGEFRKHGIDIAAVYHCPDHPTAGIGAYRRENPWRKPGPGMFLQAAKDLNLDLARSWSVGDKLSDMEAAQAAGVGMRVLFRHGPLKDSGTISFRYADSLAGVGALLAQEKPPLAEN
ncbi:MAG TPA: HAD family hydrolase [Rhizomicrobium sp.]|nr:HAD family hydrolase [Rhizomicrobium sp.]